jgi:phosphodiesterase/alkaline phosphatase D-like protein
MLTGVELGPAVSLAGGKAMVWCVLNKPGSFTVELSRDAEFSGNTEVQTVAAGDKPTDPAVGLATFEGLESSTKYWYRCSHETEDGAYTGPSGGNFVGGSFTTILDSDERGVCSVALGCFGNAEAKEAEGVLASIRAAAKKKSTAKNPAPQSLCLLGGVMANKDVRSVGESSESEKAQLAALREGMGEAWKGSGELQALATELPLYLAFNDATKGSDDLLYAEESALDSSSSKKSKSKSRRSLAGSSTTPSLKAATEFFPTQLVRKPTRHTYSKVELGANAEMFVLDTRDG